MWFGHQAVEVRRAWPVAYGLEKAQVADGRMAQWLAAVYFRREQRLSSGLSEPFTVGFP